MKLRAPSGTATVSTQQAKRFASRINQATLVGFWRQFIDYP